MPQHRIVDACTRWIATAMRSGGPIQLNAARTADTILGKLTLRRGSQKGSPQSRIGFQRALLTTLTLACSVLVPLFLTDTSALATGDMTNASCPNENLVGFSPQLPDCRAYEMVTPPYKEGYPMLALSDAANGEIAIFSSFAALAGLEGSGEAPLEPNLYEDQRTSGGWEIAPIAAPLSKFIGQIPISYEAEHGSTLWKQHRPEQSAHRRDLYLRSRDGVYSLIGPLSVTPETSGEEASDVIEPVPPALDRPIAATANYDHVVLIAAKQVGYWPLDQTAANTSLYE